MKPSPVNPPPFVPDDSPSDSEPAFDDLSDWRPRKTPKKHIYQKYFTPAERRRLKAIPENNLKSEIYLLRATLARTFALLPRNDPKNKGTPHALKMDLELCSTFSRTAIVFASLVAFHIKTHNSKRAIGDLILQALRELDPDQEL